jgi:hypothetical protein
MVKEKTNMMKERELITTPKNFNNAYRDFIDVVNRR